MGENDYQGGYELTDNQLYRGWMSNNLDMKAVLCKVRSVNWGNVVLSARNALNFKPDSVGRYYKAFIKSFEPKDEWSGAVRKNLRRVTTWRSMTAGEIIQEIRSSPEECRRSFSFLLDCYLDACKAYLIDIAITSEWQLYFIERFQDPRPISPEEVPSWTGKIENEAWNFCCFLDEDTDVSIRILMERMFTIQKIKAFLSDGAAGEKSMRPEIMAIEEVYRNADENFKAEMIRYMPGNCSRGRTKAGEISKLDFLEKLRERINKKSIKVTQTGDALSKLYNEWAYKLHHDFINPEK